MQARTTTTADLTRILNIRQTTSMGTIKGITGTITTAIIMLDKAEVLEEAATDKATTGTMTSMVLGTEAISISMQATMAALTKATQQALAAATPAPKASQTHHQTATHQEPAATRRSRSSTKAPLPRILPVTHHSSTAELSHTHRVGNTIGSKVATPGTPAMPRRRNNDRHAQ